MTDLASLFEIAATTAMIVVPAIVLNRLLAGTEGPTLTDLFAVPVDPPWPLGVQEEEPVRWRLDRLEHRTAAGDAAAADCRSKRLERPSMTPSALG